MGAPFVVVLSVMVILSLYAISMSVRSQGVSQTTRKALYVETCEELARLALDEAIYRTRPAGNDPDHRLHPFLREKLAGGAEELTLTDLPAFRAELERFPDYAASPVRLTRKRWAPAAYEAEEIVRFEAQGVLAYEVQVQGPEASETTQLAEIDFRTVLSTAPRPFDAFTLFLTSADMLVHAGARDGNANATIEWAVDKMSEIHRQIEQTLAGIPPLLTELNQKLDEAKNATPVSDDLVDKLEDAIRATTTMKGDLEKSLQSPRWPADPMWTLKDGGEETTGDANTLHRFVEPLTVYSLEPGISLERLNLPVIIGPLVTAILDREPERQAALAAGQAAQAQMSSDPMGMVPALKRTLQVAEADVTDFHNLLVAYKEFQDVLVEVSGDYQVELLERSRRFEDIEMRRKATFVFEGPGKAERAARFLAMRPPPVGVVYVNDPEAPLVVDVRGLVGRLVVYTPGDMVVEGATGDPAYSDKHALVLIAGGKMRVLTDEVQAGLVPLGGDFQGPGTSFQGSLIHPGFTNQADADLNLKGAITHNPRLFSGPLGTPRPPPSPGSVTAVLGPAPIFRRESR